MGQKNLNRFWVIIFEKNLTDKWLSEQLGVEQATISKIGTEQCPAQS